MCGRDRSLKIAFVVSLSRCKDAQEVGALVNSRRGIRSHRHGAADRSVGPGKLVRHVFGKRSDCVQEESSPLAAHSPWLSFFSSRLDGRVGESVYVVVVLGSHAGPAAGRSSIPLAIAYEKSACYLNFAFFFGHVRGNPRERESRSFSRIHIHVSYSRSLCSQRFVSKKRCDPEPISDYIIKKNRDTIETLISATRIQRAIYAVF